MGEKSSHDNFEPIMDDGADDLIKADIDVDFGDGGVKKVFDPDAPTQRDLKVFDETIHDIQADLQVPYSSSKQENMKRVNVMIAKFQILEDKIALDPLLTPEARQAITEQLNIMRQEIREKRAAIIAS